MKRIAITGGAQGIGAASARALAERGHAVAIGDIDAALVARTAATISADTGADVVGLALDVTDSVAFEGFLDQATLRLGGLDVLVNNAGIMPTGPFLAESDGVSDRQLDINLRAVVAGSKLAGRRFVAQDGGHIINIASIAGLGAAPGVAVYCATKYAVVGLGDALNQELGALGVVVTTICPGYVNTQLIAGVQQPWVVRKLALVEPEAIASAIVKAVEKPRGGQRVVPHTAAAMLYSVRQLPAGARNVLSRKLGLAHATLDTDESVRSAYRARTEQLDLASVREREQA